VFMAGILWVIVIFNTADELGGLKVENAIKVVSVKDSESFVGHQLYAPSHSSNFSS
jgi:hypothetical protein